MLKILNLCSPSPVQVPYLHISIHDEMSSWSPFAFRKIRHFFKLQVLNFEISIGRNQYLILIEASIDRSFVFSSGYRAKYYEVFPNIILKELNVSYFLKKIPKNSFLETLEFSKTSFNFLNQKFHLSIDVQTNTL